jgi:NADH:ubiquinone oxidoreductase subunit 6 (subunit J)
MFTRRSMSDTSSPETSYTISGALVSAGIFGLLLAVLLPAHWYQGKWPGLVGTTQLIGQELVNKYALPFELVSVLLLAALIGAVVLARRDDES